MKVTGSYETNDVSVPMYTELMSHQAGSVSNGIETLISFCEIV